MSDGAEIVEERGRGGSLGVGMGLAIASALVLHQVASGGAIAVVSPLTTLVFVVYMSERAELVGSSLLDALDSHERSAVRVVEQAHAAGFCVVQTIPEKAVGRRLHVVAVAGRILARPMVARVAAAVPIFCLVAPGVERLPLLPYLPPRAKSLPQDWWNAPDLVPLLAFVVALELIFNVVLIDPGQFDGALILRDLIAMTGLVGFAQFYYYARVDMVLRKLEREQAAEEARAKRQRRA